MSLKLAFPGVGDIAHDIKQRMEIDVGSIAGGVHLAVPLDCPCRLTSRGPSPKLRHLKWIFFPTSCNYASRNLVRLHIEFLILVCSLRSPFPLGV